MAQHILVTEYNPLWHDMFESEAKIIQQILGENCIEVYHIGSTAVPGLAAKPIIDILPIVDDLASVDMAASDFESVGYEYMGEYGIPGRRYLRKGGDERTHQIHIFSKCSVHDITRHLAVRDYLRTHKEIRDKYAELKKKLAKIYPYDIDGYCDGKEEFVQEMEKDALKWYSR